jgi:hypothetical protein
MPGIHRSLIPFLYGFGRTPLYTLKLTFTRVANQGQSGFCIHMDTIDRASADTYGATVTLILIQLNPVFPAQCVVRAGRDTLVVFTCQTHPGGWNLRPVSFNLNTGPFGSIFAKVGPGADGHANLTFRAKRAFEFQHLCSLINLPCKLAGSGL